MAASQAQAKEDYMLLSPFSNTLSNSYCLVLMQCLLGKHFLKVESILTTISIEVLMLLLFQGMLLQHIELAVKPSGLF